MAQGCKNKCDGDVNLWGREKPNLQSTISKLRRSLQSCTEIETPCTDRSIEILRQKIRTVSDNLSKAMRDLNLRIRNSFRQRQRLNALAKENPDNVQRYNMHMSFLHQTSSDCEEVYNASLESQEYILHTLVQLNGFKPPDKHIILSSTPNCFQLLDPSSVSKHVDINNIDNSDLIKQRTPEWYSLRESCRVTGSTMFKALGFDTLSRQKEHHHTFVCGRS